MKNQNNSSQKLLFFYFYNQEDLNKYTLVGKSQRLRRGCTIWF